MSRSRGLMSENLKEEIAKELGVYEKVKQDKISNVSIFDRAVFNDENIDQIYEIITYYLKIFKYYFF